MTCHILVIVIKTQIEDENKAKLRIKEEAAVEVDWKLELGLSEARKGKCQG